MIPIADEHPEGGEQDFVLEGLDDVAADIPASHLLTPQRGHRSSIVSWLKPGTDSGSHRKE